ncbi:MAG: 30S ribosomal protein S17 [Pseudomonadales bacterium]|nr:30S ribosomal protein S17 [Pseudomonadales bacterium]
MADPKSSETQRTLTGTVVSSKRDKTISILVERKVKHPIYGKIIKRSSKIQAHDEENVCSEGDIVTVAQSRPLSKTKSWVLLSVNTKAKV